MKFVAIMSVFHKTSVVMTHTAAPARSVVMTIRVVYQMNVAGFFTVHQMRSAAAGSAVYETTKTAARRGVAVQKAISAARRVSAVQQAISAARRVSAVPKARLVAISMRAPNLVSVAVVVLISVDRVQYVVLMVVVVAADRVHVVQT
jgi:hypothetical protein